jgi:uncharacterized glyoxalase superfamily protein PhnB
MQAPMRTMLQVNDLDETVAFYTGMLGFTLEGTWGPDPDAAPTWCSINYGPATLMFTKGANDDPGGPKVTGSLYFYPENVDRYFEALVERGASTLTAPVDREYGMREFAMEDPNGYLLMFGQGMDEIPEHESAEHE